MLKWYNVLMVVVEYCYEYVQVYVKSFKEDVGEGHVTYIEMTWWSNHVRCVSHGRRLRWRSIQDGVGERMLNDGGVYGTRVE